MVQEKTVERLRIYAWEFPVRFTHWINFLCIIVLSVTGFYIGSPFIHAYSSKQWIMGWMRLIHFIAAYAFLMSIIIRIYWSFMGNRFASIPGWFPFTSERFGHLIQDIKCRLLISREEACNVGHTTIGSFAYLIMYLIFIFQIVSGFALYAGNQRGALWTLLGGWLISIMHLPTIRLYHHLFMYVIGAFFLVHIYMAWTEDLKFKNGLISSIFSGYKFMSEKDVRYLLKK
jgi:Ni/Fe-hydrogenase 1 B-type cytochrome subunit